jgi:hypothetical protein
MSKNGIGLKYHLCFIHFRARMSSRHDSILVPNFTYTFTSKSGNLTDLQLLDFSPEIFPYYSVGKICGLKLSN